MTLHAEHSKLEEEAEPSSTPRCPHGLFNFGPDTVPVQDADEEILELYMNLATTKEDDHVDKGGLGFLDSTQSVLDIELILTPPISPSETQLSGRTPKISTGTRSKGRDAKGNKRVKGNEREIRGGVQVQQDLTALKGRKGDTGSVLWRSSLHLARFLLTQHHFPPIKPLLHPDRLRSARILELGAGTGLLALLLSPLCAEYTASDRLENLKLVRRNLELNAVDVSSDGIVKPSVVAAPSKTKKKARKDEVVGNGEAIAKRVLLEEIDWVEVSEERRRNELRSARPGGLTSPTTRGLSLDSRSSTSRHEPGSENGAGNGGQYDLVLAVDCIYNENLVQPLVDTLAKYCQPGGRTIVWVVVELRSSDVLTMFLDKWMNDSSGPWTIVRLGSSAMGDWDGTRPRWVGWVGWR